jgi:hypothetical protein
MPILTQNIDLISQLNKYRSHLRKTDLTNLASMTPDEREALHAVAIADARQPTGERIWPAVLI